MTFWITLRRSPYFWAGVFFAALAIFMSVGFQVAGATDVNVTQSAQCVNKEIGSYNVTATAHNTYTKVLHVTVKNPASDIALVLQPNGSTKVNDQGQIIKTDRWSYTFHVSNFSSWKVTFTTTDAHLIGDTSHNWTFSEVCGVPEPTTTTPPPTTCDRAIPPRDDCGPPPSTTAPPAVTTVPETEATPLPSSAPAPEPVTPTPAQGSPSTTARIALPVTGDDSAPLAGIAAVTALLGAGLVIVTRRRAA